MSDTKSASVDHGGLNGSRKANVPDGLEDFLLEFTVSILRAKPANLDEYALSYFTLKTMRTDQNDGDDDQNDNHSSGLIHATDGDTRIIGGPDLHSSCSITITTSDPGTIDDLLESNPYKNMATITTTKLNAGGKNFLDSTSDQQQHDDEQLMDSLNDIDSEYSRKRASYNSRRFSVFSKSYDPESAAATEPDKLTLADELLTDPTIKSRQHNLSLHRLRSHELNPASASGDDSAKDDGQDQVDAITVDLNSMELSETDYKIILNSGDDDGSEEVEAQKAEQDTDDVEGLDENKDIELLQNHFYERQVNVKTGEKRVELKRILRSIVLFQHMYEEDLEHLIDSMFERKCYKNEVIIRESDNGHYFYVVMSGLYDIYIQGKSKQINDHQKSLKERNAAAAALLLLSLNSSNESSEQNCSSQPAVAVEKNRYGRKIGESTSFFGELALLYNQPRSATIISRADDGDGVLYCLNRDKFQRLVIASAFKRRKMYEDFLNSVPLLRDSMNDGEISQVADALKSHTYAPGECIFKQNDKPNGMYFIESGRVKVVQQSRDDDAAEPELMTKLGVGEFFGEIALVNKAARSASVYATDDTNDSDQPCKLAFLDLDAFERLMGPCIERLKSKIVTYKNL